MKKTFQYLILLFFLTSTVFSQDFDKNKLDQYFNSLESNNRFMGSVAVSKNGEIIYSKTVGFSDVENSIKADKNSKYRIGSISKTFTSVLVMKAIEESKLTLTQTIDKYFPSIKNAEKITIKQLLTHRSGIYNFTNNIDYLSWNTQPKTEKEMVELIAKFGSDFEPNSKAEYSNSNYVLLSYILEKTFKKSFSELLQEYIIFPIGLENTYFGNNIDTNQNECKSYNFLGDWVVSTETDMSIPMGAGGIISTPEDLVKFSNALFQGKLLSTESLEMMTNIIDGFGMGLFQIPFYDKMAYGHTGGIDAFNSIFAYFPNDNISYALTSNGINYNINDISIAVLSAVFDKPYDIPEFSVYKIAPVDLDKYVGIYSSTAVPMKISITKSNNTLIAQATGQSEFPLTPKDKDTFTFDQAGIEMKFNPAEKTMLLKQVGFQFEFTKEK